MKLADLVYKNFKQCYSSSPKNSWIKFTSSTGTIWGLGTILSSGFALTHPERGRAIYKDSQLKVHDPVIRKSILKGPVLTVRIGGIA